MHKRQNIARQTAEQHFLPGEAIVYGVLRRLKAVVDLGSIRGKAENPPLPPSAPFRICRWHAAKLRQTRHTI